MNNQPDAIYRRSMTATFYTRDGSIFAGNLCLYHYSDSTYDERGEIEVWRMKDNTITTTLKDILDKDKYSISVWAIVVGQHGINIVIECTRRLTDEELNALDRIYSERLNEEHEPAYRRWILSLNPPPHYTVTIPLMDHIPVELIPNHESEAPK